MMLSLLCLPLNFRVSLDMGFLAAFAERILETAKRPDQHFPFCNGEPESSDSERLAHLSLATRPPERHRSFLPRLHCNSFPNMKMRKPQYEDEQNPSTVEIEEPTVWYLR